MRATVASLLFVVFGYFFLINFKCFSALFLYLKVPTTTMYLFLEVLLSVFLDIIVFWLFVFSIFNFLNDLSIRYARLLFLCFPVSPPKYTPISLLFFLTAEKANWKPEARIYPVFIPSAPS